MATADEQREACGGQGEAEGSDASIGKRMKVLDTNFLIDYLAGAPPAEAYYQENGGADELSILYDIMEKMRKTLAKFYLLTAMEVIRDASTNIEMKESYEEFIRENEDIKTTTPDLFKTNLGFRIKRAKDNLAHFNHRVHSGGSRVRRTRERAKASERSRRVTNGNEPRFLVQIFARLSERERAKEVQKGACRRVLL